MDYTFVTVNFVSEQRHLVDRTLLVLKCEGTMWNTSEDRDTPVEPRKMEGHSTLLVCLGIEIDSVAPWS